jgi:hypothetical protein
VSGPPSALGDPPTAEQANAFGPEYGIQSRHTWLPLQSDERQLIDVRKARFLWRVSVFGNVSVRIAYGTKGTRQILQLWAPVVIALPGQVEVFARPLTADGAEALVTLTQATGGARSIARQAVSGPAALDSAAVSYTALSDSVLNVAGVLAIPVPALSTIPLVAGSTLSSGDGFQEFEP